jgi:multicomponent Na+:H+ antiporter subunit C
METIIILLTGFLFTCGFYLILRRNMTRMLIGILFLGQAANLAILVMPGLGSGISPIVREGETAPPPGHPDPLPQALILTAIVIGFGVIAFAIMLTRKAYQNLHTDDLNRLKDTDA